MKQLGLGVTLLSLVTLAGGRPREGGVLRVFVSDSSGLAALSLERLTRTPLCELADNATNAQSLFLHPRPPVTALQLLEHLSRLSRSGEPEHVVLAGQRLSERDGGVDLSGRPAELAAMLCHPALAMPVGAFVPQGDGLRANEASPTGRPFVDSLALRRGDGREARRLVATGKIDVALGVGEEREGPQPFATYLVLRASGASDFKPALEASLDRTDLARYFVTPPARPLTSLLPSGSATQSSASVAPRTPRKTLKLLYDATAADHRAVAERLLVKAGPLGFQLVLEAVPNGQLRARWQRGDGDLSLQSVLLPASNEASLRIIGALAGRQDVGNAAAWPIVPLYTQGLLFQLGPRVGNLKADVFGLPRLDDLSLRD